MTAFPHRALRFFLGVLPIFCVALAPHCVAGQEVQPIKLAVFDFELDDFSAAASIAGDSELDNAKLKLISSEVRQRLQQSGRYAVVDTSGANLSPAKGHGLRNCNGCDAAVALKLGADQSFIGSVTRIGRTEYTVQFRIRNAHTSEVVAEGGTDLRIGADYSWNRGALWLINNRLLNK